MSKTTFACHIQFGSAIAKLDIRHCVIRKYTVARSVCHHLVRSLIGVVRSVITQCGHRSRLCGLCRIFTNNAMPYIMRKSFLTPPGHHTSYQWHMSNVYTNRAKSAQNSRKKQLCIVLRLVQSTSVKVQRGMMKSQLYTYLGSEGRLVLPLSAAEFDGLCTQFEEKQLGTLVA